MVLRGWVILVKKELLLRGTRVGERAGSETNRRPSSLILLSRKRAERAENTWGGEIVGHSRPTINVGQRSGLSGVLLAQIRDSSRFRQVAALPRRPERLFPLKRIFPLCFPSSPLDAREARIYLDMRAK